MASIGRIDTDPGPGATAETIAEVLCGIDDGTTGSPARPGTTAGTGFPLLDQMLEGGLRTGDLTLVGGTPGVGKTVVTLQWARNMAIAGMPVVYVSYEHDQRALLSRLLLLEAGCLATERRDRGGAELRRAVRAIARGEASLESEVAGNLRLRAARAKVLDYADRFRLVRGTSMLGPEGLSDAAAGAGPRALFVDYLQKVPAAASLGSDERARTIAEHLKESALTDDIAVVAVVAGDRGSLTERRFSMQHLDGAAALAYDADVIIVLNDKFNIVSRAHTAYDAVRAQQHRQQVVFTIEKNRGGLAPIDVQFEKDFAHYRFDPAGSAVEERLVDGRLFLE